MSDQGIKPAQTPLEWSVIPCSEIISPGVLSITLLNTENPTKPKNTTPRQPTKNIIVLLLTRKLAYFPGDITKLTPSIMNNKQPKSIIIVFDLLNCTSIVSKSCIV
jgi:hypothetical protein